MTEARVLIVDSDPEHAGHCEAFLAPLGFDVVVARDSSGATKALAQGRYEAVLLDTVLDAGMSAMSIPLSRTDAVVFGMSDTLVGPTNRDISIALHGCADFFEKPVPSEALTTWLRRVMQDRFPDARDAALVQATSEDALLQEAPLGESSDDQAPVLSARDTPTPAVGPPVAHDLPPADVTPTRPVSLSGAFPSEDDASDSASISGASPSTSATQGAEVPAALSWDVIGVQGGLAANDTAAILGCLAASNATGTLRVMAGADSVTFLFQDGAVVDVRASHDSLSLGVILAGDGLVMQSQLDAIARNLGADALNKPETYINAGLLSVDTVADVLSYVARRRAAHAFESQGTWRFVTEDVEGTVPPLTTSQLVWEVAENALEPAHLDNVWAGWETRAPKWLRSPPNRRALELTRWQRALIGTIDGDTSLAELVEDSPRPDTARRLLYALAATGYIGFTPEPSHP